jgi:hypothetical protein
LVYFTGKIATPTNLRFHILTWYHENLLHPGADWMFHTISQHQPIAAIFWTLQLRMQMSYLSLYDIMTHSHFDTWHHAQQNIQSPPS